VLGFRLSVRLLDRTALPKAQVNELQVPLCLKSRHFLTHPIEKSNRPGLRGLREVALSSNYVGILLRASKAEVWPADIDHSKPKFRNQAPEDIAQEAAECF